MIPKYDGPERIATPALPRFESLSVVGNSGNLKGSGLGKTIDAKEGVIRMNAAPIEGYEDDVGSKMSFRAVNVLLQKRKTLDYTTTPKNYLETLAGENILLMPANGQNVGKAKEMAGDDNEIYEFNEAYADYIRETLRSEFGKYPSTGLAMALTAWHISENIYLYGYGFHESPPDQRHYWESWGGHNDTSHSWNEEKSVLNNLIEKHGGFNAYKHK